MNTRDGMKTLHTPPITNTKFDMTQSIRESYRAQTSVGEDLQDTGNHISESNVELTKEEIAQEVGSIEDLPPELSKLIDVFINDLKQPKYVRPLNILQLSSLFQGFYIKFDRASFNYLVNAPNGNQPAFLSARESLSSGLSGIFGRSRSSSGSSVKRDRRSSSLLSTDSNTVTPMLSPEEINRQLKMNELNNLKVDRYMELCERDVFQRISRVGTSVPSPSRDERNRRTNCRGTFKVSNLFRNSPEYGEYDKMLLEKLNLISTMSNDGRIDLVKFLGLNEDADTNQFDVIQEILSDLASHSVSPGEKADLLLKVHQSMTHSHEMSNDEFLSLIIYYTVKVCPRNIFLNTEFIRLFRYKKKLVQKELFALTNLEAALVFVEGLTVNDFPPDLQGKLSANELKLLESPISSKISLPDQSKQTHNGNNNNIGNGLPEIHHPEVNRSYESLRSTFDTSLRNIFGKIRSYTPPATLQPIPLPRSSSQFSLDNERKACSNVQNSNNASYSVKKFKDREFDDLKISELKEIFEIYQKMVD